MSRRKAQQQPQREPAPTAIVCYSTAPDGRLHGEVYERSTRRLLFQVTGRESYTTGGVGAFSRAWEENAREDAEGGVQ